MIPFFAYLIKSSISLAMLYVLFRLSMRNNRTHMLNRFLLLGILLISAIIPFLNIQFFYEAAPLKQVEVFREFVTGQFVADNQVVPVLQEVPVDPFFQINPFLAVYLIVLGFLLLRLLLGVKQVLQIISRAEKRKLRNLMLAVVKDFIQPFSFLNKIVLSEKDFNENKAIVVAHEHAHIKYLHAVDLMVCEFFKLLHFFNPFMWLLRRDLKLIHEYQADQAVLQKGIDAQKYQLLVVEKAVGEQRFAMANQFTQKPILKRLKMMTKQKSKKWATAKLILFVPVLVLLLQAFARPELITKSDDFIPVRYQEDETEKWLQKWTIENIGDGFFHPGTKSANSSLKPNNVLVILQNKNDQYLIENEFARKGDLKNIVKQFLMGQDRTGINVVDNVKKEIPLLGKMPVSKAFILFQHDVESSDVAVNYTLRSIGEACLDIRKEKAQILFSEDYFDLDDEKRKAVDMAIPIRFSKKEPKVVKSKLPPPPKVIEILEVNDGQSVSIPAPAPLPIKIKVDKNGEFYFGKYISSVEDGSRYTLWGESVTAEELVALIIKKRKVWKKKYGENRIDKNEIVNIIAEEGAPFTKINELKEVLRNLQILHINYSSESKSSDSIQKENKTYGSINRDGYDVVVYKDYLVVDGEKCTIVELQEKIEGMLRHRDTRKISILAFNSVPNERVKNIKDELKQVLNLTVSTTIVTLPSPEENRNSVTVGNKQLTQNVHKIFLKANGEILLDGRLFNLTEFENEVQRLKELDASTESLAVTSFKIEKDATCVQVEAIKNILRKTNVQQVDYQIENIR